MWQSDQPFDPRAAVFVSYTAAVGLEDYEVAQAAAEQGLIANPHYALLRNNLVFSLASQGKIMEAEEHLSQVEVPARGTREHATLTATRGLVAFRAGELARGRALYAEAQSELLSLRERDLAALAGMMWAREELHRGTPEATSAISRAMDLAKGIRAPEVIIWRDRFHAQTQRTVESQLALPGP